MTFPSLFAALPPRLAPIMAALRGAVAKQGARFPALASLLLLAWGRLHAWEKQFAALLLRAGEPQPSTRASRPRPSRERQPGLRLPSGFAWLVKLVPEAACYGAQLQHLLSDPEIAAAVAAATPAARRVLRRLCRMLGVDPALWPVVPPKARPPASGDPPEPERQKSERRGDAGWQGAVRARRSRVPKSFNRPWLRWRPANAGS